MHPECMPMRSVVRCERSMPWYAVARCMGLRHGICTKNCAYKLIGSGLALRFRKAFCQRHRTTWDEIAAIQMCLQSGMCLFSPFASISGVATNLGYRCRKRCKPNCTGGVVEGDPPGTKKQGAGFLTVAICPLRSALACTSG